ncbi:hypothetical protein COU17_02705 [Candidatus Kaiserbacteria bacterium CG10_big_fil_rev_8_21_14_0_10_49_17]|uniref:Phosphoribosylglycinamide synthetase N-terminal domain-containing protein n=1 Tax=Candidatus Kaiserbacteria bacterium CG10_big_fil_rev_8_21_14_0_10_49_17 TaxID=1974609 RepID=A0A2M6WE39_9BACT|nr:MAG: hypothetical protein COU17_02705 [Candidatus Kaiserbacteria bacterium CG10_big_fil_rev_8_21_14_0_10_49_17]
MSQNDQLKILIVGGGGREHALAWKVTQSKKCRLRWRITLRMRRLSKLLLMCLHKRQLRPNCSSTATVPSCTLSATLVTISMNTHSPLPMTSALPHSPRLP